MSEDGKDAIVIKRQSMRDESLKKVKALLDLAGFETRHVYELANGYWPDHPNYDDVREPWWLAFTDVGPIRFGRRKRVLEIDWALCEFRGVITTDEVTKGNHYVHAWSMEKALEYMNALRKAHS